MLKLDVGAELLGIVIKEGRGKNSNQRSSADLCELRGKKYQRKSAESAGEKRIIVKKD